MSRRPPERINFYSTTGKWGFLSNFSRSSFIVDSIRYRTVEHYFQSQKFAHTDPDLAEDIRTAATPGKAKSLARDATKDGVLMERGWHKGFKMDIMRRGLQAKFQPGTPLADKLLATGKAELVEHTKWDKEWGDGGDGSGENKLGRLLMEVRDRQRRQQQPRQG